MKIMRLELDQAEYKYLCKDCIIADYLFKYRNKYWVSSRAPIEVQLDILEKLYTFHRNSIKNII